MHKSIAWALLCCCLLLDPYTERTAQALRLPPVLSLIPGLGRSRRSRESVLQDSISLQHSRLQARAFQDAEEEGDTSSKAEGLPSALASLEHPALATVFTQEAAKHMPKLKLAEDYYPELNRERVNILGRMASISYCSTPDLLRTWTCSRCRAVSTFQPHTVIWDPVWDLVAYVGYHPQLDAIIASFRGTDSSNWGNWVENMRSWRTDKMFPIPGNPHALVHAGFEVLWSSSNLKASITGAVQELLAQHPGAKMYAVGHSMGGALAQLCALDVKFNFNVSYVGTVTFGCPRVGNLAYQQLFDSFMSESWRFTHNRDIVPSVPLQLMGFHHVAREIWEVDMEGPSPGPGGGDNPGPTRKWLVCDESGEDPSCHNSACYLGICTSIADHLNYLGLNMFQDAADC